MPRLMILITLCLAAGAAHGQTVVFVDADAAGANDGSSWCDAYNHLQDAIDAASPPAQIRVAQGVYKPDQGTNQAHGNREATFRLRSGVAMMGGFAGCGEPKPGDRNVTRYETVLSGDLNGDDGSEFVNDDENSYHVVTAIGTDETSRLEGFTVAGGNANDPPEPSPDRPLPNQAGGGLYLSFADSVIRDCQIIGNRASSHGGGLYYFGGAFSLDRCVFSNNVAAAGGGVASIHSTSYPVVTNCKFLGNTAQMGGGWLNGENSYTLMVNCVFSGNHASGSGGAINYDDDSSHLTGINCAIVGNSASFIGGVFLESGGFTNSIIWGNSDLTGTGELAQINRGSLNYCNVQGWSGRLGGLNNTGDDPLLADADGPDNVLGTDDDDLHLTPGSPCIDAGDNLAVPSDVLDHDDDGDTGEPLPFDLDGQTRFTDAQGTDDTGNGTPPIVDRGAYESPAVTRVAIDIVPGSDSNPINPRTFGVIPVAVLGSKNFDVHDVDMDTLTFGPDGAASGHEGHLEDVNYDGVTDLVAHFRTRESGITCADTGATLRGELLDGTVFQGTDSIKTVGCGRCCSGSRERVTARLEDTDGTVTEVVRETVRDRTEDSPWFSTGTQRTVTRRTKRVP